MRALLGLPIALLGCLTGVVAAQSLEFIQPAANALTALGNEWTYDNGEEVVVRWTSEYDFVNLDVYQGPQEDGSFALESLGENLPSTRTSMTWRANAIAGANVSLPFHFELSNAANPTCGECTVNSLNFYVRRPTASSSSSTTSSSATSSSATASSTAASSPTTASSAMTTMSTSASSTASTSSTSNAIAGAAANPNSSKDSGSSNHDLAIGLGVGLGVGIPVLLAILGCIAFCLWRRRRKQRSRTSKLPRGRQHIASTPRSRDNSQMRERGSLEPMAPAPAWVTDTTAHPRSSGGGTSTASSYFEPFEFERPGSEDFETREVMSEVASSGDNAAARLSAIHEGRPATPNWPLAPRWI
ncbi:hypothetical protein B0A50_05153 [Salinomyces thailandicus]|uniref:Mid2 domain-containing protein n=1 Tax=Salinomyces thailandicus TaxID=706561 RepID=A0A4U0TY18_9PEZI|nr:hypothetical protein B0A50_05153 [Salinomyces thailandica]